MRDGIIRIMTECWKVFLRIKRFIYTAKIKWQAKETGKGLRVNGRSCATRNTVLGNNVNFNGMRITGQGNIRSAIISIRAGTAC